jgi:hypothetical protein
MPGNEGDRIGRIRPVRRATGRELCGGSAGDLQAGQGRRAIIYLKTISWRSTNGASVESTFSETASRSCSGTCTAVTVAMLP